MHNLMMDFAVKFALFVVNRSCIRADAEVRTSYPSADLGVHLQMKYSASVQVRSNLTICSMLNVCGLSLTSATERMLENSKHTYVGLAAFLRRNI